LTRVLFSQSREVRFTPSDIAMPQLALLSSKLHAGFSH